MPQSIVSQFDRKYGLPIETYRQVQNLTQRDAIPAPIRWEGMMCYVISEGLSYVLTAGMENSDWVEFGALVDVTVVDDLLSTSSTDALSANQGRVLQTTKLSDAPSDGNTYGRLDGAWAVVGGGAVDSVFGRTGAVVAQTGDYTFAQIGSKPTTLAGYGIQGDADSRYVNVTGDTMTGSLTVNGTVEAVGSLRSTAEFPQVVFHRTTDNSVRLLYRDGNSLIWRYDGTTNGTIWHSGNDGAGSGLDADLLDGVQGSGYVQTSRTLTAGDGLTGGGDLSANRTFAVDGTVVRTSGTQSIGGAKTFTSAVNVPDQAYGSGWNGSTAVPTRNAIYDKIESMGTGAVSSVFGRTGAVTAQNGDYTFAQIGSTPTTLSGYGITDAVPTSRTLTAGTGLTGGGNLTANRTLSLDTGYTDGRYVNVSGDTMTGPLQGTLSADTGGITTANSFKIGKGGQGTYFNLVDSTGGSTSMILRSYAVSGIQMALNNGGIDANGAITATAFKTTNWEIVETGGVLQFKYGGTVKFEMNSSGIMEADTNFKLGL